MRYLFFVLFTLNMIAGENRLEHSNTWGAAPVWSAALAKDTAYLPASPRAVQIYDISNHTRPTPLTWFALPNTVAAANPNDFKLSLAASGDRLVIGAGVGGMVSYDISQPLQPRLQRVLQFSEPVLNVALHNHLAAVHTQTQLHLVDMQQACTRWSTAVTTISASPYLSLSAQLLAFDGKLYQLADPAQPQLLDLTSVDHVDQHMAVRNTSSTLEFWDLTNPQAPIEISRIILDAQRFQFQNGLGLASHLGNTTLFDLGQIVEPQELITITQTREGQAAVFDRSLILAQASAGFLVFDADTPAPVGRYEQSGQAMGLDVQGNFAYLAHGLAGLRIFDITDPAQPVLQSTRSGLGSINDVDVLGDLVFLATSNGLAVLDAFDRTNPAILSRINVDPPESPAFETGGQAVLVAFPLIFLTGPNHIYLFEASVPREPQLLAKIGASSWRPTRGMEINNNTLTVGRQPLLDPLTYGPALGFQTYDFSDPVRPIPLETTLTGRSAGFITRNGIRYSTDITPSSHVFQATDMTLDFPTLRHETNLDLATPGLDAHRGAVSVDDQSAYVAAGRAGLRIYDTADPREPVFHTAIPYPGAADDLIEIQRNGESWLLSTDITAGQLHSFRIRDRRLQAVIPWMVQNAGFQGRLTLYNDADQAVTTELVAVDRQGERRSLELTLPAQGAIDRTAAELFGDLNGYSVLIYAQSRVQASFVVTNIEAVSGGDAPSMSTAVPNSQLHSKLVFGYVPGDQTAAIVLSAPTARPDHNQPVTLTLHKEDGPVAETTVTLNGNQPHAALLSQLFANIAIPTDATLIASAADRARLAGSTFVFNARRQPSMSAALPLKSPQLHHIGGSGIPMSQGRVTYLNGYVYGADSTGLSVIDARDPANPVTAAIVASDQLFEVHHLFDNIIVASSSKHITTYDVTNPAQPQQLDRLFYDGRPLIAVDRAYVYLFDHSGILSVDATRPSRLRFVSKTPYHGLRAPSNVASDFARLYISHESGTIDSYDLLQRGNPIHAGTIEVGGDGRAMVAWEQFVIQPGPLVIDYEDLARPRVIHQTQSDAAWITRLGNFFYQGLDYVQAIDLSNRFQPKFGEAVPLSDTFGDRDIHALATENHLILSGNFLRIFDHDGLTLTQLSDSRRQADFTFTVSDGFAHTDQGVFDVSNPTQPILINPGQAPPYNPNPLFGLEDEDGVFTVITTRDSAAGEVLNIFELDSPEEITITASVVADEAVYAIGSHLLVLDTQAVLSQALVTPVLIQNPAQPNQLNLLAHHNHALFLVDDTRLHVLDTTDPSHPCGNGRLDLPASIRAMTFLDDMAVLSIQDHGDVILDITNPSSPRVVKSPSADQLTQDLAADAGLIWSNGAGRLTVRQPTDTAHLIPWVVNNTGFTTRIALYNHNSRSATVQLEATDREGLRVLTDVEVPAGAVLAAPAGELFPELSGYSLRIRSNRAGLFPAFLTINLEEISGGSSPSLTTAPPLESLSPRLLFGSVPGDQIAALVLAANDDLSHTIELSLHNETGVLETTQLTLAGGAPSALIAADLFADIPIGAAVKAVSTDGAAIAGIAFVFNQRRQPSMARAIPLD